MQSSKNYNLWNRNPSRGKKLEADDPKMRAMEAYPLAQRKGVPMEFGKH